MKSNRWLIAPVTLTLLAFAAHNYARRAMRRVHSPHALYKSVKQTEIIDYHGLRIYGELITPEGKKADTLIIGSHGFNGSLLWFRQALGYRLSEEGYAVYAYDFINGSRHSKSGGKIEEMSVIDETEQLLAVYEHFSDRFENIILAGESQGGLIATLAYEKLKGKAKALILCYPAYVAVDDAKKRLEKGQKDHFGIHFTGNYTEELASIDLAEKIRNIDVPVLLIHGNADRIVDVGYAFWAKELLPGIELHILDGQDHGFDQSGRIEAAEYVSRFVKEKHL